jgi:murein DD-endopeptidase MepM/ murein hydrolase activator NlpD
MTTTAQLTSSTTTSSPELVSLEGELYIGWDGDGIKQIGMQPLSNEEMVLVSIPGGGKNPEIFGEKTSDSSGHWQFDDVPTGYYVLYGQGNSGFDYMCQSNKEFAPVSGNSFAWGGYNLLLKESQKMNVEFSNGFLTFPFFKGTPINVSAYFDEGNDTNWLNEPNDDPGHQGTDFMMPIGTPVVAAAPGEIKYIVDMGSLGLFLGISHYEFTRLELLSTLYAHMSKVEVSEGQQVYRGQRVGLSGQPSGEGPHLHFELDLGYHGSSDYVPLDPYASSWNSQYALGYWTKKNDPQFSV